MRAFLRFGKGKGMSDLISREAAIDALDAICERECEYSKAQRAVMCGACRLGSAFGVVDGKSPVPVALRGSEEEG